MKRHEVWRREYRRNRYMEYLTKAELDKRAEDIFRNFLLLTPEGKIGLRPISSGGKYWIILWTHLLEELSLRGTSLPSADVFAPETFPNATWPHAPRAAVALKSANFRESPALVKYGKKEYLRKMYHEGRIRVSSAGSYKDPSLNTAINDDERVMNIGFHPHKVKISHRDVKTNTNTLIQPVGNVTYTFRLNTNFYVYCMSNVCDVRLFDDFEADACVVIYDSAVFLANLNKSFQSVVGNWRFQADAVRYIDPLNPPGEKEIDLFFGKHFKYSYQNEIRAVWIPEVDENDLEPVYLEIGEMREYADYVEI